MPLDERAAMVGDPLAVLPALFHLLWRRVLDADLRCAVVGLDGVIVAALR